MPLRTLFIFLAACWSMTLAQEKPWALMTVSGDVQVRGANELDWVRAENGRVLHARETLRCGKAATAQIKAAGGKVFVLPENAQFEIRELRPFNREQVVLELTALELQKLPAKKGSTPKPASTFILHGAFPTAPENKTIRQRSDIFAAKSAAHSPFLRKAISPGLSSNGTVSPASFRPALRNRRKRLWSKLIK